MSVAINLCTINILLMQLIPYLIKPTLKVPTTSATTQPTRFSGHYIMVLNRRHCNKKEYDIIICALRA